MTANESVLNAQLIFISHQELSSQVVVEIYSWHSNGRKNVILMYLAVFRVIR